ncbi:MAG: hypothetical protein ACK5QX_01190 [bacterium]
MSTFQQFTWWGRSQVLLPGRGGDELKRFSTIVEKNHKITAGRQSDAQKQLKRNHQHLTAAHLVGSEPVLLGGEGRAVDL